jgi:hypothetical protein
MEQILRWLVQLLSTARITSSLNLENSGTGGSRGDGGNGVATCDECIPDFISGITDPLILASIQAILATVACGGLTMASVIDALIALLGAVVGIDTDGYIIL